MENCSDMINSQKFNAPVWIAVVDASSNVVYHEFVRHPTSATKSFGTEFHGFTQKYVANDKSFKLVRSEVIQLLKSFDRIIVSGQTGDFVTLFLSINEHPYLLPRIICVGAH